MGLARRAQGARRRRCGDIVDDEQRSDRRATPMRPSGSGGAGASASLALLDDGHRIACVAPPCICPRGARNAIPPNSRTGS
jgi:hypothetical protein